MWCWHAETETQFPSSRLQQLFLSVRKYIRVGRFHCDPIPDMDFWEDAVETLFAYLFSEIRARSGWSQWRLLKAPVTTLMHILHACISIMRPHIRRAYRFCVFAFDFLACIRPNQPNCVLSLWSHCYWCAATLHGPQSERVGPCRSLWCALELWWRM